MRCWAANGLGQVEVLDLQTGKMSGALKGSTGAIRALARHPEEPLIASVGLDRYLRIYHTRTRKQLSKVYLKQQLTGVVFGPAPPVPVAAAAEPPAAAAASVDQEMGEAGAPGESGEGEKRKGSEREGRKKDRKKDGSGKSKKLGSGDDGLGVKSKKISKGDKKKRKVK